MRVFIFSKKQTATSPKKVVGVMVADAGLMLSPDHLSRLKTNGIEVEIRNGIKASSDGNVNQCVDLLLEDGELGGWLSTII